MSPVLLHVQLIYVNVAFLAWRSISSIGITCPPRMQTPALLRRLFAGYLSFDFTNKHSTLKDLAEEAPSRAGPRVTLSPRRLILPSEGGKMTVGRLAAT